MVCSKKVNNKTYWFLSDHPAYDKFKLDEVAKIAKDKKITNIDINKAKKGYKNKYGTSNTFENGDYALMVEGAKKYDKEDFRNAKKKDLLILAKAGELLKNIADHH